MDSLISLKPVDGSDYPFLYELLKEKTPEQNISHKELPTYEQHVAFNDAHPYAHDWVIEADGKQVGRIYLTNQNEVGIHIKKEFHGFGYGGQALEMVVQSTKRPVYANIAPRNKQSQSFFEKHGFSLIQHTYRLE